MEVLHITGRIGKSAETRRTQSGDPVASFSIAVDRRKGGEKVTQWYDATIFGERANKLAEYLTKGSLVSAYGLPSARVHDGKIYMQITVREITLHGGGERSETKPARNDTPSPADMDDMDSIPF